MPAAAAAPAPQATIEPRHRPSVSFKETVASLGASRSAPLLHTAPSVPSASSSAVPVNLPGVSLQSLRRFLFPPSLENPDTTGRLELFALYGPTDEDGFLRGGVSGSHRHTDLEIKLMVEHNCREALFEQLKKPRSTVESLVNSLLPVAMAQKYTWADVERILQNVPEKDGRLDFSEVQRAIFASQRQRFQVLLRRAKGGKPIAPPVERAPKVPYQSKAAAQLMEVTQQVKFNCQAEKETSDSRRLHSYSASIAGLEDQQQSAQLRANVLLMRGPGSLDDRWDRYCAMRRTGRSSYVKARNQPRFNPSMDEGIANKHPSCSSLMAASAGGSSAAALLGAM